MRAYKWGFSWSRESGVVMVLGVGGCNRLLWWFVIDGKVGWRGAGGTIGHFGGGRKTRRRRVSGFRFGVTSLQAGGRKPSANC